MSVQDVQNKISWYYRQFDAIARDDTITEGSRARQSQNIRQSYELFGATAYREFEQAWNELRREDAEIIARRQRAAQKAEDSWNYERLRYYREQAQSDINGTMSLNDAVKLIRGVVDSSSRERARAYLESGSTVLAKYHGSSGLGSSLAWMEQEAAKLTRPPEFDSLDKQENELVNKAVKLREDTVNAANIMPNSGIGSLLQRVHIHAKVDSTSGNFAWIVDWIEPNTMLPAAAPTAA